MAAASKQGSIYHLSSLRYAESSKSIGVPSLVAPTSSRTRLDELFEQAEDDYRPGQSSSSSLLIRSNVLPLDAPSEDHSEAKDGFLRTKARAVLAQSIPNEEEDALLGVHISELGSSMYLRNRRAKNPLTRASYAEIRAKKRQAKERAKLKSKSRSVEEGTATPVDDEDFEERELQTDKAERIKREMQVDAEALVPLMPSGLLMETIHYLAAHYYDARGLLKSREGTAPKKLAGANLNRVGDGSALVALAVYLEEVAKYESAVQPNQEMQRDSNASARQAADELSKIQEEQRKSRRRKGKKAGKVMRKLYANGWARPKRRKKAKTAALDSDASDDEDYESEEMGSVEEGDESGSDEDI